MANAEDPVKKAHERTVDTLQRFYAVIIGLAVTTGVTVLLVSTGVIAPTQPVHLETPHPTKTAVVSIFIAFLSTIIVFYHGMNRHLDDTYVCSTTVPSQRLPILIDIIVFVIEAGLLFVMASTINKAGSFLIAWTFLLGLDVAWALVVYLLLRKTLTWAWINLIFLGLAWVCWLKIFPQSALPISIIEVTRSIVDYKKNWTFYFPS